MRQEFEQRRIQGVGFFQAGEDIFPFERSWGLKGCFSQPKRIGDLGEAYMTLANYGSGSQRLGDGLIIGEGSLTREEARLLDVRSDLLFLDIDIRKASGIPVVCRMEFREWGHQIEMESDVIPFGDEQAIYGLAAVWRIPGSEEPLSLYVPLISFLEVVRKMDFFFRGEQPHLPIVQYGMGSQ